MGSRAPRPSLRNSRSRATEVAPRRQRWPADLVGVESLTEFFDVPVKVMRIKNLIQSRYNGCAAVRGRS